MLHTVLTLWNLLGCSIQMLYLTFEDKSGHRKGATKTFNSLIHHANKTGREWALTTFSHSQDSGQRFFRHRCAMWTQAALKKLLNSGKGKVKERGNACILYCYRGCYTPKAVMPSWDESCTPHRQPPEVQWGMWCSNLGVGVFSPRGLRSDAALSQCVQCAEKPYGHHHCLMTERLPGRLLPG